MGRVARVVACSFSIAGTVMLAQPASQPATVATVTATTTVLPTSDPRLLGLRYRSVGPSRGGRVTAVTGVASQPGTFYMGVASGGVFRTSDNGGSWAPITDGQVPLGSIGAIAVAETNPQVIYVGTGSDGVRSNVSTGRGVYRSGDGGKTWTFAGLYGVGQIGAVRIHPANPDTVWVAANGDVFKPGAERGIYKTTDGGRTWKKTLFVSDAVGAMDVELQPGNPDVVYAWMSRIERKPWTIISGSREGGFYKSTDGGERFTRIATGLPGELIGKGNLAVTAAKADRIYALVEALPGGGLYRSDDAGQSWAQVNTTPGLTQRPFYYTTIGADPTNADVVYAGAETFYKSVDGGRSLTPFRTPHVDNHDIWISPRDGNVMVQANDGGANVSLDGGRTWSTQNNQPTGEFYGVWVDDRFPYQLYGAQQDNSTVIMSSVADPYAMDFRDDGPGCETGPILPHPSNPQLVYGSCKGQFGVMNMDTLQEKQYWIGGQSLYGNPASALIYRMQRVSPMATSPHDPAVLYYGSQYVHRTRDNGVTWERISPDLTANLPCCQGISGEPITRDITGEEFYSTLYAITESPIEKGVIWAGANDGPFHVTRDDGRTWTEVTPKDLPSGPGGRVQFIEASRHRKGSAYYAMYRYLLGDYRPYIYRTDDYGKTWVRLTDGSNGIPADWPTRVVREDPDREGLLYAGTEFGMFISFDNGKRWLPFQLNLPNVPITDIKVHRRDLVIATQGRGFWILDNLGALQQIGAAAPAAVTLFKPRDGYRTRVSSATLGPMLEYYLPAVPAGPVAVEILDPAGTVVASASSDAAPPATGRGGRGGGAAAQGAEAPDAVMMEGRPGRGRGGSLASRVTRNAGHNRFVWDVRDSAGLSLPPGTYQARVSAGGVVQTQPLVVRIDPRLASDGTTESDLREQYEHNVRMRALVADVRALSTRLRQAQAKPVDAAAKARVDAVAARVLTEPVRYGKPGLEAHITYLAGMTTAVDQKIGRDAIERYAVLKAELEAVRAEADEVLGPAR